MPATATLAAACLPACSKPRAYGVDYAEVGGAPLLGVKGACLVGHGRSIPRAIRNAIRFANVYASSHDDADFCMQVRRAGWDVVYLPTVQARHDVVLDKAKRSRLFLNYRNKFLFLRRQLSGWGKWTALATHVVFGLPRYVGESLRAQRGVNGRVSAAQHHRVPAAVHPGGPGDVHHRGEVEHSIYNFEQADVDMLFRLFDMYEAEALRIIGLKLVLPAYDYCLKCSHTFNLLNARGAISVAERNSLIGRVRNLARLCAEGYLKQREEMGFPLLKK